jgi:hypothetical protein
MKCIVWTDDEDNFCITYPAYGDTKRPVGQTDDELLALVIAKAVKSGDYQVIDDADIPADRYFRNAWEWSD